MTLTRRAGIPALVGIVALGAILSGCAAVAPAGQSPSAIETAAEGQCGSVPSTPLNDPEGLMSGMDAAAKAAYTGFSGVLKPSFWSKWKPATPPPYDVAIVYSTETVPYQATLLKTVKEALEKSPLIGKVTVSFAENSLPTQLQQFQAAIQASPDLILYQPLAPDPFVPLSEQAAAAGIPSLTMQSVVPSDKVINVSPNSFLLGARPTAEVAKLMGGKGTMLGVRGVKGVSIETETFEGIKKVLELCPGITLDDSVVGAYNPTTAKTEVLKWLSTHQTDLGGVVQASIMGNGVISAFEQSGRPMPPMADAAASEGSLAYWEKNAPEGYKGAATGQGPQAMGSVIADVALRVLNGDGIKVNTVLLEPALITDQNLADWAVRGAEVSSGKSAEPPAGTFPPAGFIDQFFAK
ncbi:substrate-binding domain-containing protein [Pseudarthrobacter phenanthrenivorans]|uniref:substrate-binding domain-containing protein n=1 Tax=Pseudarthrobacter phenanthrenivorans TaxID=361575 RepID=UPI002F35B4A3